MGRARAETARALFLRRPRAQFGCRVLPSSARSREPTHFARCGARHRQLGEERARARHGPPPPQPVSARAHQRSGGGGERSGGARATSELALPGTRGRARACRRLPPLSTRPSSRPGRWGRGCGCSSPVPSRAHRHPTRSCLRSGTVAGAHHVSGSKKEIAKRAREEESRCSCCRDPTERGLSRPLPFSMSRTMRGGAGFRRSHCWPMGNEVQRLCAVFGARRVTVFFVSCPPSATLHTGKCSPRPPREAGIWHAERAHWPNFPGNALCWERPLRSVI